MFNNRNDVKQGEIRQRIMKLAAVLLILVLVAWTGALRPASYAAKKKTATKTTKTKTSKTTKTAAEKKKSDSSGSTSGSSSSKKTSTKKTTTKKTESEENSDSSKSTKSTNKTKTTKKKTGTDNSKTTGNSKTGSSDSSSGTSDKTASDTASKKAKTNTASKSTDQTDTNDSSKTADQTDENSSSKTAGKTDTDDASNTTDSSDTSGADQKTDTDADTKTGTGSDTTTTDDTETDGRPVLNAAGAEVYCENTGEVVFTQDASKKANPYNTATLMTALLAAQKLSPDRKITISESAAEQPGGSTELEKGEVVTVEQLLYEMLLDSADDAAYALAENSSGSVKAFVKLMNKMAKNIGCKHTHFSDPAGSGAEDNYTTASDFMKIVRVALATSSIAKIAGTEEYTVPKTNKHESRTIKALSSFTTDKKYGIESEITGTYDDQSSVAASYRESGLQLFIVLLGDAGTDRSEDLKSVIDYVKEHIQGEKVVATGKNVGKIRIGHGAKTKADVYTLEAGYAYLPKEGSKKLISTKVVFDDNVKAPVTRYQVVGSYQILVGGDLVNSVPLVVHEDIAEGWFPSYLGISNNATLVICGAFLAAIIAALFIASARSRAKRRKRMAKARRIRQLAEQQLREEQERKERGWRF